MSYDDPVDYPPSEMPLLLAASLQDHLMTASNDLERLQRLLDDACVVLMDGFHGTAAQLGDIIDYGYEISPDLQIVRQGLYRTVTALQFQDMATQLIEHTNKRLRNCADQIAREALGDDDPDGAAVYDDTPMKPNPVTQDEVDSGSVELF
ncbi:MAG: hypothetical protein Q7U28_18030 [Aquabacterium sp.]|nr:hypothetical protein [Aquabacterium sp.]